MNGIHHQQKIFLVSKINGTSFFFVIKQDTEYELLVAKIHQGMLNYDGFENLRVEHNVTLTGKSGAKHQIDVFWEFVAAGITYRTCVECKNYRYPVKKFHVAAFAGVLADIGNANGIIATKSHFQKGAKDLAAENNIRLVLVNNLLKSIEMTSLPRLTRFEDVKVNLNEEYVKNILKTKGLTKYSLNWSCDGNQPLLDQIGQEVETINSLFKKFTKKKGLNKIEDVNLYLDVEDLGNVLVDSFEFIVKYIDLPPMKSQIDLGGPEVAVIEDIVNNNKFYLNKDGTVVTDEIS